MAVRKYDETAMTTVKESIGNNDWRQREARVLALQHALGISESGSKAEDIIADAKLYAIYLLEG